MEQRGSRRGKEKADAATIPKIAGPGRKGSPEFVFGGRIAVEQDMLAAAGVVKVQNGGLSRSRQPRTFRVLQGGNQFDGAPFITGGQYGLRVSSLWSGRWRKPFPRREQTIQALRYREPGIFPHGGRPAALSLPGLPLHPSIS